MEKDTLYAYKLKKDACTLQRIRTIQSSEILSMSSEEQDSLHEALERGTDIISSEIQMCMYMYSYGKMHIAKMKDALEHMDKQIFECDEIAIVDYGCGQGIGTLTLIEYLKTNNFKTDNIKSVTLIEPSKICLERAELHISLVLPKCKINTINKKINDISIQELAYTESNVLHIFSNILDVEGISLKHFSTITQKEHISHSEYICVGPYFGESSKQSRYDNFGKLIGISPYYNKDYPQGEWLNNWTYSVRLYSSKSSKLANYPRRNKQPAKNVLTGKTIISGKNKEGNNVILVDGIACGATDFAFDIIHNEKWNRLAEVQYLEFEMNGRWIPAFCKASVQ